MGIPEVGEVRTKVRTLLARELVRLPFGRLSAASECWEELRRAMRVERGRCSRGDLAPLAGTEVARVRREIDEVGRRFSARGEWAEAIWAEVAKWIEELPPYLWPVVPGLNEMGRSTVGLERAHRDGRQRIRRRTGPGGTGEAMGEMGSRLAFGSNARCERFVREGLAGVNPWEAFVQQDVREVHRRMAALPREGRRPRVMVARGKAEGRLAAFVELWNRTGPREPGRSAWAASVGSEGLPPGYPLLDIVGTRRPDRRGETGRAPEKMGSDRTRGALRACAIQVSTDRGPQGVIMRGVRRPTPSVTNSVAGRPTAGGHRSGRSIAASTRKSGALSPEPELARQISGLH